MASVLGLAEEAAIYGPNSTRLLDFTAAWARAWPGLHIEHQPTFANHIQLMGYALAAGTYQALSHSLAYLRSHNATCDYHLLLEDDGIPFNATSWPGGADTQANDLDARLDALDAAGGTALILGGHDFKDFDRAEAAKVAAQPHGGIVAVQVGDGSYGYIIKCSAMEHVAARIHAHVRQTAGFSYFERVLWDAFKTAPRPSNGTEEPSVYASAPLLVDHAVGFSGTWNRTVNDAFFQGNATFW